jgi:tubulin delta
MEEKINWRINLHSPYVNRSLANVLILRGKGLHEADLSGFSDPLLYSRGALDPLLVSYTPLTSHGYEKSATLVTNSQSIIRPLDYKIKRAFDMFSVGAYLHQYYGNGLEKEEFKESFLRLEKVLVDYKKL